MKESMLDVIGWSENVQIENCVEKDQKSPKFEENLENLKNRATQLLIKYKSEALVTQLLHW